VAQKKFSTLPELSQTLVEPDASDPAATTLELDELWSFVRKKSYKRWIWIALCRSTRQVVAYVVGDRSQATCQKLWDCIPPAYRSGHCYSDFWEAYRNVIPEEHHTACGKESGETAHALAVEQHTPPALGALCQKDFIILEVRPDARGMSTIVHSPVQSLVVSHLTSPLPDKETKPRVQSRFAAFAFRFCFVPP